MFRLVVLPCFDLCRSNSFHVQHRYIYYLPLYIQYRPIGSNFRLVRQVGMNALSAPWGVCGMPPQILGGFQTFLRSFLVQSGGEIA